jgi:hypothetical protein
MVKTRTTSRGGDEQHFTSVVAPSSSNGVNSVETTTALINNVEGGNLHTTTYARNSSHSVHSVPPRFPPFQESYADMDEIRKELKVIALKSNLPYFMQHSSPQRLEARCPTWKNRKDAPQGSSCEFVVAANRHTNGRVYVTRVVLQHSSNCSAIQKENNSVSASALLESVKPFVKKMNENVKPKDMAQLLKEKFGVSASYMTAWRALSGFRNQKKQEEMESFMKIKGYLDTFVNNNPGSITAFEYAPDSTIFSRAFLCPKAMQSILHCCRSNVLLSTFLVVSRHGGVVLTATAQDAMGQLVPLAIGIVPSESEENWIWFLQTLRKAIPDFERFITSVAQNRGEELQNAILNVFQSGLTSDHIDTFTSGSTESFEWVEMLCHKAPLMILVGWVSKVASTLFQRYDKYSKMSSEYPEELQSILTEVDGTSDQFEVLRISEQGFEVIDHQSGRQRIVDFDKQTCTCGEYDVTRFPCRHVILATSYAGLVRTDFIPKIFLTQSLKTLYSGRVIPIDIDTIVPDNFTTPPPAQKTRGRPRKILQIQQFSGVKQDRLACSICGVKGHNKRTCKRLTGGDGNAVESAAMDAANSFLESGGCK